MENGILCHGLGKLEFRDNGPQMISSAKQIDKEKKKGGQMVNEKMIFKNLI